jgi:ATP-dependent Clp protease ATP-binding subunit ClpC
MDEEIPMEPAVTIFNRFSEPARRVIFWARLEAGRLGAEAIEAEHLLLGLLTEDQGYSVTPQHPRTAPWPEPFFSDETAGKLRMISGESIVPGAPKPPDVDMPLSKGAKRVLIAADHHVESAKIQLLHLLWALTSDGESAVGKLLNAQGITLEQVEAAIQKSGT